MEVSCEIEICGESFKKKIISCPDDADVPSGQGDRSDLRKLKRKLDEGASDAELWDECFVTMARYNKVPAQYRLATAAKRRWQMEVLVFYGPTGSGKTSAAYEFFGDSIYSLPPKKGSGTYWDGYWGQETVLIDECYGGRFSHGELLQLLDRYPLSVPVHGGTVNFSSKRIIMTSNKAPEEWYQKIYIEIGQDWQDSPLRRRMTQPGDDSNPTGSGIFYFGAPGQRVLIDGSYEGVLTAPEVEEQAEDDENNNNNIEYDEDGFAVPQPLVRQAVGPDFVREALLEFVGPDRSGEDPDLDGRRE
jgi:hypothetical protein